MRIAHPHKFTLVLLAVALLLVLMLLPRHGHGAQGEQEFGDYVVHFSAISTNQLVDAVARQYGIQRSSKRGLLNVALERKGGAMIGAQVSAEMSDLAGHRTPVSMRETSENGDVDYLGEFALSGSGAYLFTVKVTPNGSAQPLVVKFNQDYVVD